VRRQRHARGLAQESPVVLLETLALALRPHLRMIAGQCLHDRRIGCGPVRPFTPRLCRIGIRSHPLPRHSATDRSQRQQQQQDENNAT
jgi:hypothetical protein